MQWDFNDQLDERVVKATDWLAMKDYKKLEDRAGVYIFTENDFNVKYIGKAGAGRMMVEVVRTKEKKKMPKMICEVYSAIKREKNTNATLLLALYPNSDKVAIELEQELIKKYDPPNNGVDLIID